MGYGIAAGFYSQASFISTVKNYISNNATRALVSPVRITFSPATPYCYKRNITKIMRTDTSSNINMITPLWINGDYSADNSTWTATPDQPSTGNFASQGINDNATYTIALFDDIVFI